MATNGMTINGLNPLSALTADDKIPVWDTGVSGEPTKEITAQNLANSVKSLAGLPNTTEMNAAIEQSTADVIRTGDVINNLTSTNTDKPLSANMGKTLNDKSVNFAKISFNIPSSGNTYTLPLPSGFSSTNCFPLAIAVESDAWYWNQTNYVFCYAVGSAIILYYRDADRGRRCKVILMKSAELGTII